MTNVGGRIGYKLLGTAFAIPAAWAARKAVDRVWRNWRGEPPPDEKVSGLLDAVMWAALSAGAATAGRLIANRSAATAYRMLTGNPPPGAEDSDHDGQEASTSTTRSSSSSTTKSAS